MEINHLKTPAECFICGANDDGCACVDVYVCVGGGSLFQPRVVCVRVWVGAVMLRLLPPHNAM